MTGFTKRYLLFLLTAILLWNVSSFVAARITGTQPARTAPDTWSVGRNGAEVTVDNDGNFIPTTDNDTTLGTSVLRWATAYILDVNVGDDLVVTDDVTVGDTLAVTGVSTLGRVNYGLQLSTAPRTSTTLVFNSTGTLVYNTTDNYMCLSTGSAQTSFIIVSTGNSTTACAH